MKILYTPTTSQVKYQYVHGHDAARPFEGRALRRAQFNRWLDREQEQAQADVLEIVADNKKLWLMLNSDIRVFLRDLACQIREEG